MSRNEVDLSFSGSELFSLGVEIEFQIIDGNTMALCQKAPEMFKSSPKLLLPRLSQEFLCSIFEIQTGICKNMRDVENDLHQTCSYAEELAEENNGLLFAAGLHPFSLPEEQKCTDNPRYQRIMDDLQQVGREFMAQGLHVHVGMPDGDTALRTANAIQFYLPLFLALSASSPYFKGKDTGLMSYRTKLFEVMNMVGILDYFNHWDHYTDHVRELVALEVVESTKDLWWDVRPNHSFGTIEIRICDLPVSMGHILGIVSLIQAVSAHIAEQGIDYGHLNRQVLLHNKWQACRYGLDGEFIDPGVTQKGKLSFRQGIEKLLEMVSPMFHQLGSENYVAGVREILDNGNGAEQMKRRFEREKDWKKVIQSMQSEFWDD